MFVYIRLALALVVCVLIGFDQYGIGAGGKFYHYYASYPFEAPPLAQYFYESILHVVLANLLGFAGSHLEFSLFVLSFAWIGMFYVASSAGRRLGERWSYVFFLFLIFHPLLMITYSWVLHPDALTFLCSMVVFLSSSVYAIFAFALFGTLAHASQMLVIVLTALGVRLVLQQDKRPALALALSLGWLLGRGVVELYLFVFGISYQKSRFTTLLGVDLGLYIERFLQNPFLTLYTHYLAYWVLILVLLVVTFRFSRKLFGVFFVSQLAAYVMTFLTADTTRVFAILSIGPLVYTLLYVLERRGDLPGLDRLALVGTLLACIAAGPFVPKIFSYKGEIKGMQVSHDHLIEVFRDPTDVGPVRRNRP